MANRAYPDPGLWDYHADLDIEFISGFIRFSKKVYISTVRAKLFVHYLPFKTRKLFFGLVHYGHLFVPGQV